MPYYTIHCIVEVGLVVKTVNVSAVFFGPAKYRKRTGRFLGGHQKRPTYRPFPGGGVRIFAHVSRKRWPSGFSAKRPSKRKKDGRLRPPLIVNKLNNKN